MFSTSAISSVAFSFYSAHEKDSAASSAKIVVHHMNDPPRKSAIASHSQGSNGVISQNLESDPTGG
jgi:hypothetical protein